MNPEFQHAYVIRMHNIFLFGFLISLLLTIVLKRKNSDYFLTSLPLFAVTAHQVEEYIISPLLLGDNYHFLNWAYQIGLDISSSEVVFVNSTAYLFPLILYLFKPSSKLFSLFFLFGAGAALANGMFHLGVATLQEAIELRIAGFKCPILVRGNLVNSKDLEISLQIRIVR